MPPGLQSERLQCSLSYQVRQAAPGQSKEVGIGAAQENGVEDQAGQRRGEKPEIRKKGWRGRQGHSRKGKRARASKEQSSGCGQ